MGFCPTLNASTVHFNLITRPPDKTVKLIILLIISQLKHIQLVLKRTDSMGTQNIIISKQIDRFQKMLLVCSIAFTPNYPVECGFSVGSFFSTEIFVLLMHVFICHIVRIPSHFFFGGGGDTENFLMFFNHQRIS